jgi:hypothetical protein
MIYRELYKTLSGSTIYAQIDDDGLCRLTCTEDYPEFQAWLAEGNEPLPADEELK